MIIGPRHIFVTGRVLLARYDHRFAHALEVLLALALLWLMHYAQAS